MFYYVSFLLLSGGGGSTSGGEGVLSHVCKVSLGGFPAWSHFGNFGDWLFWPYGCLVSCV